MHCFMCFSFDEKLQILQDMDNDIFKRVTAVFPDLTIPESQDPVFVCATCLEQVSCFYTIKKVSLQNCCRLKQFNALLKGTNNFKYDELSIKINKEEVPTELNHIEIKVEPNHVMVKGKVLYDFYSQQLVKVKSSLKHSEDGVSSGGSNKKAQKQKNSQVDKLTEKDSNLTSIDSRHEDQPKTQRGSQEKIFKCSDCHKTFTKRCNLEQHIRVHTGEKPYKCPTCQKTFALSGSLNLHKRTHTGEKPHECDVCHKTFTSRSKLKDHSRVHTGEKPYKCATCQKTFALCSNLNKHKLTHTGEKRHECDVCHRTFSRKRSVISHKRIHNNVRPSQCAVCSKTFTTCSNLSEHMLTHTGD